MKAHLLNSAMMPIEGIYTIRRINANEFVMLVNQYYTSGKLLSYIGYESTRDIIQELTNIRLPINRCEVGNNIHNGDILLICKLKYRLPNPADKKNKQFQQKLTIEDFEFFCCTFKYLHI